MPYVQRDEGGKVMGLYRLPQPGYAEEFLPEDHADVVAYRTPPERPYWKIRKDLYRERIAAYKSVPDAGHQDVIGFVLDAMIKTQNGDTAEMADIVAIVQGVKEDVPKS